MEIDAVEFDDLDDIGLAGLTGPTVFGTMWRFCVGSIPGAFAFVFFAFGVYVRGHGRRITTALERVPAQVLGVTMLIAIAVSVAVGILCGGAFHLAARNLLGSGRGRGLGEPGWLVVVAGASIVLAGALGFAGVEIVDGWLQSETTAFVKNATVFYVSAGVGALGGALFAVQPFRR